MYPHFTPGTWSFAVGNTQQLQFGYYDNLGYQYDVSGGSNWSSSAGQVIGVQTSGQNSPGLSTAVSQGSATVGASYLYQVNVGVGQMCTQGIQPFCPQTTPSSSGQGTSCAAQVTISGDQSINDGSSGTFSVQAQGCPPTRYTWSYSAPDGSGNNPDVTFGSPAATSTSTDGHWFAYPDQECGGTQISTYTISAKVDFAGGSVSLAR